MNKDKDIIKQLVHYINKLLLDIEGDDVLNELTTDMIKWGFWDEDGFPIEDDGDTE
jgi:hypothetical protein